MTGWTNKGKFRILQTFAGVALPTNFFVALVTDAVAPGPDTNTLSELTEIAAGNGYTAGGISLTKNTTDFDVRTEDDALDRGFVQIKDLSWTASVGSLPGSGSGARYAVLTDDNGTLGSREVWAYWDLLTNVIVSVTQSLTLQDLELRGSEV